MTTISVGDDMEYYGNFGPGSKDNKPNKTIKSSTKIKTLEERVEFLEKELQLLKNVLLYNLPI